MHYKVNFYYPFIDHVIQHFKISRRDQMSISGQLNLLDETVVAKIEESLGNELPNNTKFAQEVGKLTP